MKLIYPRFSISDFRFSGWKPAALLFLLGLTSAALATDPLYQNFGVLNFFIPGAPPPVIDVTNFDNENQFNITFNESSDNSQLYEPENVINFTNNGDGIHTGVMTANNPIATNGFIFNVSAGVGFQFDTLTTNVIPHQMAGTFYNTGDIRCDSLIDGNNVFNFIFDEFDFSFFIQLNIGECLVSATNIINPGAIDVSENGFMQLSGQNVDLSGSTLTVEQDPSSGGLNIGATGAVGIDTNGDWDPSVDLGATFADASFPDFLDLTNSTSYFEFSSTSPSNNIIHAVFVQNTSPNAPYNVYFGPSSIGEVNGGGEVTIEWVGSYVDTSTGLPVTRYLYLNDDIVAGSLTNATVGANGVPDNFAIAASPVQIAIGFPAPSGFFPVFSPGGITNPYSFFNAQLIASTEATNASASNPSGSLTNLPGQIQITANRELNLNIAQISLPSYLSLMATNQFDGSAGAAIASAYSDINLGVTNGFMTVTNLLEANIPAWSGTLQAWSTRWLTVDTNGVTNDFRVLIVNSDLIPVTAPTVRNLRLHGTNSLVISDVLNVIGSLYFDAQNLTLGTNLLGEGATSPDGELNWLSGNTVLNAVQMPNLLWVTNNGAFRVSNLAQFIGAGIVTNITAGIPAIAATGTVSEVASTNNVVNNDKATVGATAYVFVSNLTNSAPDQIKIAATFDGSMSNFIAAINHGAGLGTVYSTNTIANPLATAGLLAGHAFTVTATTAGPTGNSFPTTTTSTNLTWNGHATLIGGANGVAGTTNTSAVSIPYGAFINNSLLADQGTTIWATNFLNCGILSNGVGNFILQSATATFTNGSLTAGGNVSLTGGSLVVSNLMLQGGSMTLSATNLLTDTGVTNGNIWVLGTTNGTGGSGFSLTVQPTNGDLLGTTVTNYAPGPNKRVNWAWAGQDFGVSTAGYTNNAALGRLILNAVGPNSSFAFSGAGTSNAIYVDYLELQGALTNGVNNSFDFGQWLTINPGMRIYFAQAIVDGVSAAEKINNASLAGKNNGRLLWVPQYVGFFSSTNLVAGGITNIANSALAASPDIDSDGDGIGNAFDSSPFFTTSQFNLKLSFTNQPLPSVKITWNSIPGATNIVSFTTNLASGIWLPLLTSNSPSLVPPAGGWPITNTMTVVVTNNPSVPHFYRVRMDPNTTLLYGP